MRHYHNTTAEAGQELKRLSANAMSQDDLIEQMMKNSAGLFTAWGVLNRASKKYNWPITSVRRALTNLTKANKLLHLKERKVDGPMGVKETCYVHVVHKDIINSLPVNPERSSSLSSS